MDNWLMHWRVGLFGPPWFRVMRKLWGMYRAGNPIVGWDDVKDLCQRLADAEARNAELSRDRCTCGMNRASQSDAKVES